MKYYLMAALLALSLAPHSGGAQQSPAARIEAAKQRAASAGIPVSLLESRVAEGRAKGIPLDRIAQVVERRAATLEQARQAFGTTRGISEADLSSGADAVEAGINGQALRSVIADVKTEDRSVAIAVLTYLHRERGLPVDRALTQVRDAARRGSEALRNLPAQAAAGARGQGRPAGVGRPDNGAPKGGGPPAAVPAPGAKPGGGKPATPPGKGSGGGRKG